MSKMPKRTKSVMPQSEWIGLIGFAKCFSSDGCYHSKKLVRYIETVPTFQLAVEKLGASSTVTMLNWLYNRYYSELMSGSHIACFNRTKRKDFPLNKVTIDFLKKKRIIYYISPWSGESYWRLK